MEILFCLYFKVIFQLFRKSFFDWIFEELLLKVMFSKQ